MLAAVLFFSTNPLFMDLALGDNHPFLFNGVLLVGLSVGMLGYLWAVGSPTVRDRAVRTVICRRLLGMRVRGVRKWDLPAMIGVIVVGRFGYALYGWAIQLVGASATTVLVSVWPIMAVLWLSKWDRGHRNRYRKVSRSSWVGIALAFLGMAAAVVGAIGFDSAPSDVTGKLFGAALALTGGCLAAASNTLTYLIGCRLADEQGNSTGSTQRLEYHCVLFAGLVGGTLGVVPNAAVGLASGGILSWQLVGPSLLVGLSFLPGTILSRKAILITPDLSIQALVYLSPLLAQGWLWIFTDVSVARFDVLLVGSAVVAGANMLLATGGGHRKRTLSTSARGPVKSSV